MKSLCVALLLASACTTHIAPYKPKQRRFDPGRYDTPPAPRGASLWSPGSRGLFEDDRASRVGDVLVVKIDETDFALQDDSTKMQRKSDTSLGVPAAFGLLGALRQAAPDLDPAQVFASQGDTTFDGGGRVQRRGRVTATLAVRVRRVLPNGDLYVEGTKVVLVGNEERHLYVSGIVRPSDVRPDNSVPSSRIADAEIEYAGRGDLSDQQRQGWLTRLLTKIWPF